MAWRYRCGTCEEGTDWMGRDDAERARDRHHARAHNGLIPDNEELVSNAEGADYTSSAIFFAAVLALSVLFWLRDLIA